MGVGGCSLSSLALRAAGARERACGSPNARARVRAVACGGQCGCRSVGAASFSFFEPVHACRPGSSSSTPSGGRRRPWLRHAPFGSGDVQARRRPLPPPPQSAGLARLPQTHTAACVGRRPRTGGRGGGDDGTRARALALRPKAVRGTENKKRAASEHLRAHPSHQRSGGAPPLPCPPFRSSGFTRTTQRSSSSLWVACSPTRFKVPFPFPLPLSPAP